MTVLIATDAADYGQELENILVGEGFNDIFHARSATHLYQSLGIRGYRKTLTGVELVLLDNRMRDIDGLAICQELTDAEDYTGLPVVMVTVPEGVEDLATLFSAGAVDYITLPSSRVEVVARVRAALRLKEAMDDRRARELELLEVTKKLAEANRVLNRLAYLDGLTGVANRRYFDEFLEKEWRRAVRLQKTMGLIMIDIDFFKAFNDIYGHQEGDDCLKRVAGTLEETLKRPGDHLVRYGGEEFAVILAEELSVAGANSVAERLRAAVAALGIENTGSTISDHVTISLGVAVAAPDRGSNPELLKKSADMALYTAKKAGRDRVRVAARVVQ